MHIFCKIRRAIHLVITAAGRRQSSVCRLHDIHALYLMDRKTTSFGTTTLPRSLTFSLTLFLSLSYSLTLSLILSLPLYLSLSFSTLLSLSLAANKGQNNQSGKSILKTDYSEENGVEKNLKLAVKILLKVGSASLVFLNLFSLPDFLSLLLMYTIDVNTILNLYSAAIPIISSIVSIAFCH